MLQALLDKGYGEELVRKIALGNWLGMIERTACVAVRDPESPEAVVDAADATVAGTDGMRRLLDALVHP